MNTPLSSLLGLALLCGGALAQTPFQGNGVGAAFLTHSAARIGGTIDFALGSTLAPSGIAVLAISDGLGPSTHPVAGTIGLDYTGAFQSEAVLLDAQGLATPAAAIPNNPSLVLLPPVFAQVAVLEPGQISLSKTTRVSWENPDSYSPAGSMLVARAAHTATALGSSPRDQETRVLITGGGGGTILVPTATASTELYSPLTRSTTAGPAMAVERALHTAVRLVDGRVLVCGGTDTQGNVTAHAEVYDPATNTFTAVAAMVAARVGHAATLLDNGLVLVTGGLANYTNPATNLAAVLNTAQDTGELFDPATGQWTPVPGVMGTPRSGHTQTLLADGRVLIVGGIRGGTTTPLLLQVPVYSQSCTIFDPATGGFSPTGSLTNARAFHGASVLPGGDVLITGGSVVSLAIGLVGATDSCERWNGSSWSVTGPLPLPLTNHVQLADATGAARIYGGLSGLFPNLAGAAAAGSHDGTAFTASAALGTNPGLPAAMPSGRGAIAAARLFDGSVLLLGGTDGAAPLADNFVHTR